jgi:hypothetical protein
MLLNPKERRDDPGLYRVVVAMCWFVGWFISPRQLSRRDFALGLILPFTVNCKKGIRLGDTEMAVKSTRLRHGQDNYVILLVLATSINRNSLIMTKVIVE